MAARAGYNSLCAMCNAAPRALAPSHATRVAGLLRSVKSSSSASEYDFVASVASRETRKVFASSRTSRSAGKCQERSGEGGTLCPAAVLQIAAVTTRRTNHRQVVFITGVSRFDQPIALTFLLQLPSFQMEAELVSSMRSSRSL